MTDLKAWRLAVPPKRKRRGRVVSAHAGFLTAWLHKGFNEKVLARVKEVAQAAEGAAPTRFWVTGGWGVRGGACRGGVLGRGRRACRSMHVCLCVYGECVCYVGGWCVCVVVGGVGGGSCVWCTPTATSHATPLAAPGWVAGWVV